MTVTYVKMTYILAQHQIPSARPPQYASIHTLTRIHTYSAYALIFSIHCAHKYLLTHNTHTNTQNLSPQARGCNKTLQRGSWGIFGDSSVTLAQLWRAWGLTNLVIRRSPVRFRPKTRQLRFTWIWANRPSSKGSKVLFPVIKAH